jgi:hypothetical protein
MGHTGTGTRAGWHGGFASMSSQCPYYSPFPPREQLLTAVVGGATVVVVAAVVQFTVDVEGAWVLAPGPIYGFRHSDECRKPFI